MYSLISISPRVPIFTAVAFHLVVHRPVVGEIRMGAGIADDEPHMDIVAGQRRNCCIPRDELAATAVSNNSDVLDVRILGFVGEVG
jgi:hypothetical protein